MRTGLPIWAGCDRRSPLGVNESLASALCEACYRHDPTVIAKVAPASTARYPINFMQALTDGVVLPAVLAIAWIRPRPRGWITGWFPDVYGALRLTTEQFRVSDPDIPDTGVTLPMVLSGAMCIGGVTLLWGLGTGTMRTGALAGGIGETLGAAP